MIPQFVADWISERNEIFDLYPALKRLENSALSWEDVYEWYRKNTSKFVNAYLTGKYEVEEEQKYYVIFPTQVNQAFGGFNLVEENFNYLATDGSDYWFEDTRSDDLSWEERSTFTEQEIKDYDERFWPFAVNQ